jgi:hypothetical protein
MAVKERTDGARVRKVAAFGGAPEAGASGANADPIMAYLHKITVAASLCLGLSACAALPPAHWAQGGTRLDPVRARWILVDMQVDVMPDGKVLIDGEEAFVVDRAGRVIDLDGEAIALLEPDGRLVGPGDRELGTVGSLHAARPREGSAWLTVEPSGRVVAYGPEGERLGLGMWVGCSASARAHQVCTLVTHLLTLRVRDANPSGGMSIGVGVGVGVRVR